MRLLPRNDLHKLSRKKKTTIKIFGPCTEHRCAIDKLQTSILVDPDSDYWYQDLLLVCYIHFVTHTSGRGSTLVRVLPDIGIIKVLSTLFSAEMLCTSNSVEWLLYDATYLAVSAIHYPSELCHVTSCCGRGVISSGNSVSMKRTSQRILGFGNVK